MKQAMEDQQFLEKVSPEADELRFSVDTVEEAENLNSSASGE